MTGRPAPPCRGGPGPSRSRTLVAMVVVPTPPFGLNTATVRRARAIDTPSDDDDRRVVARALESKEERLDPGLELAAVERLGHDVVGAGLEERDPLVDGLGLADAQDRDADHRRVGADLAAQVRGRLPGRSTTSMMTSWWRRPWRAPRPRRRCVSRCSPRPTRTASMASAATGSAAMSRMGAGGHGASPWSWRSAPGGPRGWTAQRIHRAVGRGARGLSRARLPPALSAPCRIVRQRGFPIGRSACAHAPL